LLFSQFINTVLSFTNHIYVFIISAIVNILSFQTWIHNHDELEFVSGCFSPQPMPRLILWKNRVKQQSVDNIQPNACK